MEGFFATQVTVFDAAVKMEEDLRNDLSYLQREEEANKALGQIRLITMTQTDSRTVYKCIPELNGCLLYTSFAVGSSGSMGLGGKRKHHTCVGKILGFRFSHHSGELIVGGFDGSVDFFQVRLGIRLFITQSLELVCEDKHFIVFHR